MIKLRNQDFLWAYIGYFFDAASNILLLPLVLRLLSGAELGLWYTFLGINSLIYLLDRGFNPIITRNVSAIMAGAKKLNKKGDVHEDLSNDVDSQLFITFIGSCKRIYTTISLIAFIILIFVGTPYIIYVTRDIFTINIMISWIIFIIGIVLNYYYSYWNPLLIGSGMIKENKQILTVARIIQISISAILLLFGYGIISMSIAYLSYCFVSRYLAQKAFFKGQALFSKENLIEYKVSKLDSLDMFKTIWHNASKVSIVSVGQFFTNQSIVLITSYFFSLETTAAYGLTMQLMKIIIGIAGIGFNTYQPIISQSFVRKDLTKIKAIVSYTFSVYVLAYAMGVSMIALVGNRMLVYFSTSTTLLKTDLLIFLSIILLFDEILSMSTSIILLSNDVIYGKSILVSGLVYIIITLVFTKIYPNSLLLLFTIRFTVQLAYNYWKWPQHIFRMLELNVKEFLQLAIYFVKKAIKEQSFLAIS